jgi:hypothetical protein
MLRVRKGDPSEEAKGEEPALLKARTETSPVPSRVSWARNLLSVGYRSVLFRTSRAYHPTGMKTADKLNAILVQMAVEDNSTLTPRDEDDDEGLGAGFFLKIAGVCVAIGIGAMVIFLIFSRAVYAWGFFGAFIALGAVLCLFAWLYDRRNARP